MSGLSSLSPSSGHNSDDGDESDGQPAVDGLWWQWCLS